MLSIIAYYKFYVTPTKAQGMKRGINLLALVRSDCSYAALCTKMCSPYSVAVLLAVLIPGTVLSELRVSHAYKEVKRVHHVWHLDLLLYILSETIYAAHMLLIGLY